jgi:hypothetical protein
LSVIESPTSEVLGGGQGLGDEGRLQVAGGQHLARRQGHVVELGSATGSMPSTVTGAGSPRGVWFGLAARYVLRSSAGAATATPAVWAITSTVAG